jgi:N-acetylglucosamine-6-sulfatase
MKSPHLPLGSFFVLLLVLQMAFPVDGLANRPNIIFIMADDHTAHAIGAYGGRLSVLNPTPTLDRLASEGLLFENCFAVNSICVPSRAAILTGQYNHRNRVYDLGGRLEAERQFLPRELGKLGYQTSLIGKWHLTEEPAAFEHYTVLPGQGDYFDPTFITRGEKPWPENSFQRRGQHVTDAINELAIDWLKNQRDPSRPFLLMYHHKAPHDYFEYAPRYQDYLAEAEIPEPESLWRQPAFGSIATRGADDELLPYLGSSIGERHLRRNYVKTFKHLDPPTAEQRQRAAYQDYLRRYLRCVKGIDDSLASFFGVLRELQLMDNSIIIYTSDQGMMLGEHDYQDKRWMYEESMRMPLIIRYPPRIAAGQRTDAIIENVDFAPTLLDFAGGQGLSEMQGGSFKSLCETGREPAGWKQAAYYRYWMHLAHHFNPAHLGLRTKKYKLIYFYGMPREDQAPRTPPGWELYDLQKDPQELVNVYGDPAYAEIIRQLKLQLAERRREIGDDGRDYPEMEAVIQEFWDDDAAAQRKAIQLSHDYLEAMKAQVKPAKGGPNEPSRPAKTR